MVIVQMKLRHILLAVVLGVATLLAGCESIGVPQLGNVTRIEIRRDHNELLSTITDAKQIAAVVTFTDSHRTGWGTPWSGVPIPIIVADFYDGETFKGHIGVGANFLETQRVGGFWSRSASNAEIKQFLTLVGLNKHMEELYRERDERFKDRPPKNPQARDGELQGYYLRAYELSSFVPCGSWGTPGNGVGYWLDWGNSESYRQYEQKFYSKGTETVYLRFAGHVSAMGSYGHLGQYSRQVTVNKVIEMSLDGKCH